MAVYDVTLTVKIIVPDDYDTDEDLENFITDRLDQEIGITYEIDNYDRKV